MIFLNLWYSEMRCPPGGGGKEINTKIVMPRTVGVCHKVLV